MGNAWTSEDVGMLEEAFARPGLPELPAALLARHTRASCNQQAYRRRWTKRQRFRSEGFVHNLTPADVAYLAGIIDGEGYVKFDPCLLTIGTTDEELYRWLMAKVPSFGSHYREPTPGRKGAWYVRLANRYSVGRLGELVLPYLVLERKRQEFQRHVDFLREAAE